MNLNVLTGVAFSLALKRLGALSGNRPNKDAGERKKSQSPLEEGPNHSGVSRRTRKDRTNLFFIVHTTVAA